MLSPSGALQGFRRVAKLFASQPLDGSGIDDIIGLGRQQAHTPSVGGFLARITALYSARVCRGLGCAAAVISCNCAAAALTITVGRGRGRGRGLWWGGFPPAQAPASPLLRLITGARGPGFAGLQRFAAALPLLTAAAALSLQLITGAAMAAPTSAAGGVLVSPSPLLSYRNRPLTLGVASPSISQLNISSTICRAGWTATIRPNTGYTQALKRALVKMESDQDPTHYELDHNISLQLGGDPVAAGNLWMQHYAEPCGARQKDVLEGKLKRLVCTGQLTLIQAQVIISNDWVAGYNQYVKPLRCAGE